MGVFDNELTLPGVITEILPVTVDASAGAEFGTTESVTIIGTAFNGPVGEPVPIGSPEQAIYYFGDSFDPETKRQATLVPEIQDAYDRGCRTIYAVRVSGKEMYKDFDLAVETNLKLRVSGYYPFNGNKKCFMTYQATQGGDKAFGNEGEGIIRIYKPADRTVIAEKTSGVVDTMDSILVTEINLDSEGFTKDSRLCDVLDVINNKLTNNVLKFFLVDENGAVRTNSDLDVQQIPVGALFPGIYTICRDKAGVNIGQLVTDVKVVRAEKERLYPLSNAAVWKKLEKNTDPSKPYPLGASTFSDFSSLLKNVGVIDSFDFLRTVGEIDKLAVMNKVDYEEVDLSGFELYNKLGSGFVRTAVLKEIGQTSDGQKKFKVVPAPDGDDKRVIPIEDGIYSTLRMHNTDYTVLAAASCETDITGKLPKKSDFRRAIKSEIILSDTDGNQLIKATPIVDMKDVESELTKFKIEIQEADRADMDAEKVLARLSDIEFRLLPVIAETPLPEAAKIKNIKDGLLVFCLADKKIYKLDGGFFVEADPALIGKANVIAGQGEERKAFMFDEGADIPYAAMAEDALGEKDLVTVMTDDKAMVFKLEEGTFKPFCAVKDIADKIFEEEDFTAICIEAEKPVIDTNNNVTLVTVKSTELEFASVEEFVETLNKSALGSKFLFGVIGEAASEDIVEVKGEGTNRKEGFEYVEDHIPYTTTDNLARHLAQHCFHTSLQSYPTHGVIGCDKLSGVTLSTIAQRVDDVCKLNLDMYAKKNNGNNIYTNNNRPYSIGRCVSIVFAQYPVSTGNGYGYMSSGASGYAGMLSTLDADVSSTNQNINIDSSSMMFNLSNYQLTRLNAKGIVCFRKVGENVKVVDGITQDEPDSPYRRLSTIKVMNATAKLLRDAIQPFIGKTRTDETMNSLETAIKSVLNKVTGVLINKYSYSISTDNDENYLGIVRIKYAITPAYEIKQVFNELEIK